MDPAQSKSNSDNQNSQKMFCKQPITCPWITNQPYPSTLNKNRTCDPTPAKSLLNIPLSMESRIINEKSCPSLQHSSSQFFYFLRLMQLFPETHPATLHTVLCLCKNDFFCAVDKLLYAKRCKSLYSRSQGMFKRCSINRSHPYCGYAGTGKVINQQEKVRSNETVVNFNVKESVDIQPGPDVANVEVLVDNNLAVVEGDTDGPLAASTENEIENDAPLPVIVTVPATSIKNNQIKQKTESDVTSPDVGVEELKCDKAAEA